MRDINQRSAAICAFRARNKKCIFCKAAMRFGNPFNGSYPEVFRVCDFAVTFHPQGKISRTCHMALSELL